MDMNFRPSRIEIDLDKLASNIKNIRKKIKKESLLMAIVKADAYGHGSIMCSKIFLENGADRLGVSTIEEGVELRKAGIKEPILILNYIPKNQLQYLIKYDLIATIYNLNTARSLNNLAREAGKIVDIHIKLDTGMNRLGFPATEDATIDEILTLGEMDNLNIEGVYSHFCRADEANKEFTQLQYRRFMDFTRRLEDAGLDLGLKHISNSAGIINFPDYNLDMVRAGIILYGLYPSAEIDRNSIDLGAVLELRSRISHIKSLEAGVGIGYGHKYITKEEEKIATIPIGYGDGFTRMLSNKGSVYIKDKEYAIVGNICMDQMMITAKLDDEIEVGDEVLLLSEKYEKISADSLAELLNSINYEVLCMFSRRIPRLYLKDGRPYSLLDRLLVDL